MIKYPLFNIEICQSSLEESTYFISVQLYCADQCTVTQYCDLDEFKLCKICRILGMSKNCNKYFYSRLKLIAKANI